MDQKVQDRAAGRPNIDAGPGHHSQAAPLGPRVRFCAWCHSVTIFAGALDDHIAVAVACNTRMATLNGHPMIIQDGICGECDAKERLGVGKKP
jgi:hypothetical protein